MPRTGRQTKLTPAIQQALVTAITAGVPMGSACALAHVPRATVAYWIQRGLGQTQGPALYAPLCRLCRRYPARASRGRGPQSREVGTSGARGGRYLAPHHDL